MEDGNKVLSYIHELTLSGYSVCFSNAEKYMMILIRNSEKDVCEFIFTNPSDEDVEAELKKAVEIYLADSDEE